MTPLWVTGYFSTAKFKDLKPISLYLMLCAFILSQKTTQMLLLHYIQDQNHISRIYNLLSHVLNVASFYTGSSTYVCPYLDNSPFLSQLTQKKVMHFFQKPEYWLLKAIVKQKANMSWDAPEEF